MARAKTTAVAKPVQTELFSEERPDFLGDGELGQENVNVEDLTIPRLGIIQDLSPQRKRNEPEYIEGAEEGMLFNSVTSKLYGDKVFFIPCFFKKEYLLWKHRDAGGGFNGAYPTKEAVVEELNARGWLGETFTDNDGNKVETYEAVETGQQYGILVDPTGQHTDDICISMSKSQLKVSRQLNTMIKMAGGDRFSRIYEIKAAQVDGPKGKYFNYAVRPLGFVNEELYELGKKLYEAVSSGERTVKYEDPAIDEEDLGM